MEMSPVINLPPNINLKWKKMPTIRKKLLSKYKTKIRAFEGCNFLELYRDKHNTNIFFTYSYWDSEDDLNNYRHSSIITFYEHQLKVFNHIYLKICEIRILW